MTIEESEEILKSIKNADGIIIRWPKKKEEKRAVLEYLITKFEKGKRYSELEVNMILKRWHSFGDHSLLRRELYDNFLNTSVPQKDKLLAFGFSEVGGILMLKKEIADGQFYAEIKLSEKTFTADVFETATNEKYVLFNVASAQGAFVGQIRSEVQDVIEEIRERYIRG